MATSRRFLAAALCTLATSHSLAVAGGTYHFKNVIDNTWALPQGDIWGYSEPSLSQGTAAFHISFEVATHYGAFLGNGSFVESLLNSGDPAPTGAFVSIVSPSISKNNVAIFGTFSGNQGLFLSESGLLTPIVKTGDLAPIGSFTNNISTPSISNSTVAFTATFNASMRGVFKSNHGTLTTIAQTGDVAPVGTFHSIGSGAAVSGENVAFVAQYDTFTGIFRGDGNSLTTIIQSGDAAPTGTFLTGRSFGLPSISGDQVAFFAYYGVEGESDKSGIFVGSVGPLQVVAKTGDPAPDGVFTGFDEPSISGNVVAFGASYSGGDALFVATDGSLSTVIKNGDPLFGSTISNLSLGRFGLDDSENGALVFQYNLFDGRSGIAIASLVPEPTISGVACAASLTSLSCSRGRRRSR